MPQPLGGKAWREIMDGVREAIRKDSIEFANYLKAHPDLDGYEQFRASHSGYPSKEFLEKAIKDWPK